LRFKDGRVGEKKREEEEERIVREPTYSGYDKRRQRGEERHTSSKKDYEY
jgi:hypothetical protein